MTGPTSKEFLEHAVSNTTQYTIGWRRVCQELLDARARIAELERQIEIANRRIADPSVCKHGSIGCIECEKRCEQCGCDGTMAERGGERLCENCTWDYDQEHPEGTIS